jgi:hypothetical protein
LVFWILVLDRIVQRLDRKRENRELKQTLIRRMGSSINTEAARAVEELRHFGWLRDGSLHGISLIKANLQGAQLWNADLSGAYLIGANLEGANLRGANLERADLGQAALQNANLEGAQLRHTCLVHANLSQAQLRLANMTEADLTAANLEGVNLFQADLSAANLRQANLINVCFDAGTMVKIAPEMNHRTFKATFTRETNLPNNQTWTPDTDLSRFTNPAHPAYQPPKPAEVVPKLLL